VGVDGKRAIQSRRKIPDIAADNAWLVGGAHLPLPGLNHVRRENQDSPWIPVKCGPLPSSLK